MHRATASSWPDDDNSEFSKHLEVLKVVTPGPGIPEAVSDGDGGVRSFPQVTSEICTVIRFLDDHLTDREIGNLLGFSTTTVSNHANGRCPHEEPENINAPPLRISPDELPEKRVTDHDTMIVTGAGSDRYHRNAGGEPACGRGNRNKDTKTRGGERDAVEAHVWHAPCKICFWRHYVDGMVSRRIAEIEYELHRQRRDG